VWADRESFRVDNATYKSECGSCHVAYPPALLPARSWQAIVDGLDRHFGTNAAVDDKSLAEIRAFLLKNAGRDRSKGATPILRITETPWFKREHREVPASIWSSAKVKSPSNCGACHQGAHEGNFEESSISIPK
jgi:nitrate/TMAO reductase-like tetraheme cytochrome c subunit